MADKWKSEGDEPVPGAGTEEEIRGVATDDEEFDAEELDDDEAEDEESGSTF